MFSCALLAPATLPLLVVMKLHRFHILISRCAEFSRIMITRAGSFAKQTCFQVCTAEYCSLLFARPITVFFIEEVVLHNSTTAEGV